MTGEPDPAYVLARRVLLDALKALEPQLGSVILVGAQAVYLHASETGIAVAPYTTDADLALDVDLLTEDPRLEDAMNTAGFAPGDQPGAWIGEADVNIDLMVAAAQGGAGSRGARIPPHDKRAARTARGLEGALIDRDRRTIRALDASDPRSFEILVAGPAALLIAKTIKIDDRRGDTRRESDKDALDMLRLLRAIEAGEIAERMVRIGADNRAEPVAMQAMELLAELFGAPDGLGCSMAVRATERLEDPEEIAASCTALAGDVLDAWKRLSRS